ITTVARSYGLEWIPVRDEHYDFTVPRSRQERPAVTEFRRILADPAMREQLRSLGFGID
ncbi:MAG: hypothetical protein KDA79_25800, partial [Planctomycetaceae bacterium]|nr:hypothetical protein [Planctomycetaceae bacterium]